LRLTKKYGLRPGAGFTLGHIWENPDGNLDGETEEDLELTYGYVRGIVNEGLLWSNIISVIDPIPGSKLHDIASRHDLPATEDYEELLPYDRVRLSFRHPRLSPEVVERYYLKIYRAVALNPGRFLMMLSFCRNPMEVYAIFRTGFFLLRSGLVSSLRQRFISRAATPRGIE
jgi:hypothetical protein